MRNGVDLSADPDVTTYQYDLLGNLASIDRENGVATLYEYDDLDRVTKISHGIRDAVNPTILDTLYGSFDYTLAANGQRDDVTENIRQDDATYTTKLIDYVYDEIGRLTREDHDSSVLGDDFAIDYTYDLVGNRLDKKTTFEDGNVETIAYTYNDLDQLLTELTELRDSASVLLSSNTTSYGYDDNGSQTSKTSTNGDTAAYTYNLQNRLSHAVIDRDENGQAVHVEADYTYDENGIRVRSDTTTTIDGGAPTDTTKLYIIDPNNPTGYAQVLEEWDATDPANPALLVSYLLALDVLAQALANGPSALNYFLTDTIGSNRLLVDAVAAVTARHSFDGYGNILGQTLGVTDPAATSLLYTGEQFDPNLASYYLRARIYDPSIGRFTRFDPFAGFFEDPKTLHRFLYASADPIGNIDPSGHFTLTALNARLAIGLIITNIGLTTYSGLRKGLSAKTIALNITYNIAIFPLITGAFWSGPFITIAAGTTLLGAAAKGLYDLYVYWPDMDAVDRSIAIAIFATYAAFGNYCASRSGCPLTL